MVATVANSEAAPRALNLALQGGGAHGAYSWGCWTPFWRTGVSSLKG